MSEGPIECTEDRPWDGTLNRQVRHHGAYELGEQEDGWPGGDIVRMKCAFCGHEWTKELPQ